jgi:hypothetical protein
MGETAVAGDWSRPTTSRADNILAENTAFDFAGWLGREAHPHGGFCHLDSQW